MKSQGVIYHGSDESAVVADAYKTAVDYMAVGSDFPRESIEKFALSGAYPNFFHLKKSDDENEISVDNAREMMNFLAQKPSLPGNRAVLIENFEDMSRNAANSILKVLEEPPLDSILILTTTRLLSILPTIRSRCIKIRVDSANSPSPGEFSDLEGFVSGLLKEVDKVLLVKFVRFIDSNCRGFLEFSKSNAEDFELFLKVAMAYCSFKSSHDGDLKYSKCLLNLQSFCSLSKNTYPDKQTGIIAVCQILSGVL